MGLESGTRLGPYEIVAAIGAGGMGEVYRARDPRLGRDVAIKVLPPDVAADPERRERFEREARAVAALNHPHICTLHDVGHQDGVDFLVMEYVEGETLAARLTKGRLPLDQTLKHAIEIAVALDAAHRHGIVHRDLKPANVMITKGGVKLLDFGLAKLIGPAEAGRHGEPRGVRLQTDLTALATTPPALTAERTILGTLQYMAPEQVEGQEADARTDIFAFGATVYEMATGKKAFEGRSQASLIAAILDHHPPPIAAIQPLTPPELDHVVTRCLAKDPERRWQTARDVAAELEWTAEVLRRPGNAVPDSSKQRRWKQAASLTAFLAVVSMIGGSIALMNARRNSVDRQVLRFSLQLPEGVLPQRYRVAPSFAISPDGRSIVFQVQRLGGSTVLALRRTDSMAVRILTGTDDAELPFWSPDSTHVGFFANRSLKKMLAEGGVVETLCEMPPTATAEGFGDPNGTWNEQGTIVFSAGGRLYRVGDSGGRPVELPIAAPQPDTPRLWPQFLPGGDRFLYLALGVPGQRGSIPGQPGSIYVGSLSGSGTTRVVDTDFRAVYASRHLLFLRDGRLRARAFDPKALKFVGPEAVVSEADRSVTRATQGGSFGRAAFSASQTGTLVYREDVPVSIKLLWLDRQGHTVAEVGPPGDYLNPRISPDGGRVALERHDSTTGDVWLVELSRQVFTRFTFSKPRDPHVVGPIWSPDGQRVTFKRGPNVYDRSVDGGEERMLAEQVSDVAGLNWSPDGRTLLYCRVSASTGMDIWVASAAGGQKPVPFLSSEFEERNAQLSPAGNWMVYESNESGDFEIYAQRFPGGGGKRRISTQGGRTPVWRGDGKELFYVERAQRVMAVDVRANSGMTTAAPVVLFEVDLDVARNNRAAYDAAADGQHFIVGKREMSATVPLTVVLNWTATLKN